MAFSVNRITLVGALGADAEYRSFQNGGGVVNLRVATSESWKDRDGQRQERTEWHTVAVFSKWLLDEAKQFRKGDRVMVEGKLQTRKWQDQSGNDRYSTEVVVQGMDASLFKMAPKDRSGGGQRQDDYGGGSGGYGSGSSGGGATRPQPAAFDSDLDDDVPF
jgi:single-strand DNA-binding protein